MLHSIKVIMLLKVEQFTAHKKAAQFMLSDFYDTEHLLQEHRYSWDNWSLDHNTTNVKTFVYK